MPSSPGGDRADVKRYDLSKKQLEAGFSTGLYDDAVGRYVRYDDYARLELALADRFDQLADMTTRSELQEQQLAALLARAEALQIMLEESGEALELALSRLGCSVEANDGGGAGRHDAESYGGVNTLRRIRFMLTPPADARQKGTER